MKILIRRFLLLLITQPTFAAAPSSSPKNLAIVIDDFGNNMPGTEEILNLPIKLTVAVMPFLPSTKTDAELAFNNGHDVLVHLPMEPKKGKKNWLGPQAITTDLSDDEIRRRVEAAIQDVPHAVGMNHHMGSKATEDERVMRIVLDICKKNGLFYLDSKTTGKSVVSKLATEMNVPFLENDLFFDHVYTTQHIKKQAQLLDRKLLENERIIAIGHVGVSGPIMVDVLKEYIPVFQDKAEIVGLSDLIPEYKILDKGLE
ncbi:divergent polysaccharide deacetylase family protein [Sporosarcina sp. ACRSL]|uniref:divergent polysaccharide deacetylase family protein n=1 Tax=Sporosarcina sp. ACRSL TaxID=2918215 RepID=UPI001EF6E333|nr:divergent polysaccharide deacetylase family protein [Sporosarcina sp. ACRSL]MCG7344949.1 divergent polysaccharide deacetylase family protein [Sporosarcina sp. ACRSL]